MAKGDLRQGSAPIRKVFELMLEDMGLSHKVKETKVLGALPDLLGEVIFKKIEEHYIYDQKLFLKTYSAPLKNELFVIKDALLQKLNEVVDETILKDIIIR